MKKIWKRTISVFLAVILLLSAMPMQGFVGLEFPQIRLPKLTLSAIGDFFGFNAHADAPTHGTFYDNIFWDYNTVTHHLELYGSGNLFPSNYIFDMNDMWLLYRREIRSVTICNGITGISKPAFYDCISLTEIEIPNSVTWIGGGTFQDCASLKKLTIPKSVVELGFGSLAGLTAMRTAGPIGGGYDLEFGWTDRIPDSAFAGCSWLTDVTLPEGITELGSYSFEESGLTNITIPPSLQAIEFDAFVRCAGLTAIDIPDNVKYIGQCAFEDCTGLTSVNLPDNDTVCDEIHFIDDYPDIQGSGNKIFSGCTSLKRIDIPDSFTRIPTGMFNDCSGLQEITIPENVTHIGGGAFNGCTGLTSITIPENITHIGSGAFKGCKNIVRINYNAKHAEIGNDSTIEAFENAGTAASGITVAFGDEVEIIPRGLFYTYKSTPPNIQTIHIGKKVSEIGDCAFDRCSGITDIVIPGNVNRIGDFAFNDCTGLENLELQNGLQSIGSWAFTNCSGLKTLAIPDSVIEIEREPFINCSGLTEIVVSKNNPVYHADGNCLIETESKTLVLGCKNSIIPKKKSVTAIAEYAFRGCTGLTSIDIPDTIESVGSYAFWDCTGLTSVSLSRNLELIDERAFDNCSFSSVTIPYGVVEISNGAFENCKMLSGIIIPITVTRIILPFDGCDSLSDIYYGGSPEEWEAIECYANLENVVIHYYYHGEDLKGYYLLNDHTLPVQYEYDDSFFSYDNTEYHHDVAEMSLCLAMAACSDDGGPYAETEPRNAYTIFNEIGFVNTKSYGYDKKPETDSSACVFSMKNLDAEDTTVIAIATRGGGYESEWASNFTIANEYGVLSNGDHKGFSDSANKVLHNLDAYLSLHYQQLRSRVVVWIAGYSRGAAIANLVAARLKTTSDYLQYPFLHFLGDVEGNIFAYTFATPLNTTKSSESGNNTNYNYLFNIVNPDDIVPRVAPEAWGFTRYGKTLYLPCDLSLEGVDYYPLLRSASAKLEKYTRKGAKEGISYSGHFTRYVTNTDVFSVWYEPFVISGYGQRAYSLNELIKFLANNIFKNINNYVQGFQNPIRGLVRILFQNENDIDLDAMISELAEYYSQKFKEESIKEAFKEVHFGSETSQAKALLKILFFLLKTELTGKMDLSGIFTMQACSIVARHLGCSADELYGYINTLLKYIPTVEKLAAKPSVCYTILNNADELLIPHYSQFYLAWMKVNLIENNPDEYLTENPYQYRILKSNCPVNVDVYDSSDNHVASISDDSVSDFGSFGLPAYIDESGQKCIILPNDDTYKIIITATDDGSVSCHISETDSATGETDKIINYYSIPISDGDVLTCIASKTDANGNGSYTITDNENKLIRVSETISGSQAKELLSVNVSYDDSMGYCLGSGNYEKGEYAQLTAFPDEEAGAFFEGWYNGTELLSDAYNYRFCVTENVSITAKFRSTDTEYTLSYDANGGIGAPAPQTGIGYIELSYDEPEREGYTFTGWARNSDSLYGPIKPGDEYNLTEDVTLYAVWMEKHTDVDPPFDPTAAPKISIHNYTANKTIDYRTTITFSTDPVENPVSGAQIRWFIDGQNKGAAETYTVKEAKKDFTVQAKYVKDGTALAESEIETVRVNAGFFARLKAFFRALFGRLPKVVQEYLGVEIIDRVLL